MKKHMTNQIRAFTEGFVVSPLVALFLFAVLSLPLEKYLFFWVTSSCQASGEYMCILDTPMLQKMWFAGLLAIVFLPLVFISIKALIRYRFTISQPKEQHLVWIAGLMLPTLMVLLLTLLILSKFIIVS